MTRLTNDPDNQPSSRRVQRRQQRSFPFSVAQPKIKRTPRGMPPVLVRGGSMTVPSQPARRAKSKKRYDVALSVPGAELRLPSLPAVHFGWRLLSALMVILLGGLFYYVWNSPEFRVQGVEVQGLQRLTRQDMEMVLDLQDEPIFAVSPIQLKQDLQAAFPELSSVNVEVSLPALVSVAVEERVPVLIWRDGEQEVWLDTFGAVFPPRGDPGSLVTVVGRLPLTEAPMEGAVITRSIDPGLIAAIVEMSAHAPEGTPIIYQPEHGLGWVDSGGWKVYFGYDLHNMEMKLRMYQALVERLDGEGVKPDYVSVEFLHAPYYRMEQ